MSLHSSTTEIDDPNIATRCPAITGVLLIQIEHILMNTNVQDQNTMRIYCRVIIYYENCKKKKKT